MSRIGKSTETENRFTVSRGKKTGGNKKGLFKMDMGFPFGVIKMLWNKVVVIVCITL